MLTRQPNSFSTITQQLDFAGNPGATSYEIKYAKGGVVQPDGSLSSPALKDGFLNRTTGKVELIGAREPGTYTIVARAKLRRLLHAVERAGDVQADRAVRPLVARVPRLARPELPGARRSSREPSAAGSRVTVAIAKGKKGKKFRTLGKAKVNSKGVFKLRFTRPQAGTYRVRYSFTGNATVARGTVYEVIASAASSASTPSWRRQLRLRPQLPMTRV